MDRQSLVEARVIYISILDAAIGSDDESKRETRL